MKLIDDLISVFFENYHLIEEMEDDEVYVKDVKSSSLNNLSKDKFIVALNEFPSRDNVSVEFNIDDNNWIRYSDDFKDFESDINKEYSVKDEDSELNLKIRISKNTSECTTIYSLDKFIEYISDLDLKSILEMFNNLDNEHTSFIVFEVLENSFEPFRTSKFVFNKAGNKDLNVNVLDRKDLLIRRDNLCNFQNAISYKYIPQDFYLDSDCKYPEFKALFDKLLAFFSIVFIANISSLDKTNFFFQVDGYKGLKNKFNFSEELSINSSHTFFEIYNWCYKEGNLADKLSIARNLIPINVSDNNILAINSGILQTLYSNHNIYLKENVQRYLEIKNNISMLLTELSSKANEIVFQFIEQLKKNIFAFLTYFGTVIVFNSLSTGKLSGIFTKDITIISFGLVVISSFYLIVSYIEILNKKKRFESVYLKLKKRYADILDKEDINRIFQDNDEYNQDVQYINRNVRIYNILWISILLIITTIVLSLTEYALFDNYSESNYFCKVFTMTVNIIKWISSLFQL
jgi:hypothetical protein